MLRFFELLRAFYDKGHKVSADDTDLILQSDQSVARVNSRLAWSFEWAWMIYAVSVGYRVSTCTRARREPSE